jgi:6-pyruvoyl-tetrahydropterin synthase
MYRVSAGIFVHFAHHVRGHDGPCISLHGHTWQLEVGLKASQLDASGFVFDFDRLHSDVLTPAHQLLDHSLAVGFETWAETRAQLAQLGTTLVESRRALLGDLGELQEAYVGELHAARNERPGGIKVAVFPFNPTSELLAEWLFGVAKQCVADKRVQVDFARIYETMHPTQTIAEFRSE